MTMLFWSYEKEHNAASKIKKEILRFRFLCRGTDGFMKEFIKIEESDIFPLSISVDSIKKLSLLK